MADDDSGTGSGSTPPRRFGQRIHLVIPDNFDEPPPPDEIEAWEAPDLESHLDVAYENLGED